MPFGNAKDHTTEVNVIPLNEQQTNNKLSHVSHFTQYHNSQQATHPSDYNVLSLDNQIYNRLQPIY